MVRDIDFEYDAVVIFGFLVIVENQNFVCGLIDGQKKDQNFVLILRLGFRTSMCPIVEEY